MESFEIINLAVSEDEKFEVCAMRRNVDANLQKQWVNRQEVKLLTLDGTFGGCSANDCRELSTDLQAQDDWHIGKKYDMQGWFRYAMIVTMNDKGMVHIKHAEDDELHNAYLVVSKKALREKSKSLMRAKTDVLESISNEMVEQYIRKFNNVADGNVIDFIFIHWVGNNAEHWGVKGICENIYEYKDTDKLANEIIMNIPFNKNNNQEFDKLLKKVLLSVKNN